MENKTNLSANSTLPAVFIFEFGAYPLYNQEGLAKIPFKAVMGFLIILTNLAVILAYFEMKKKTYSNALFFSIALSDLLIGSLYIPLSAATESFYLWRLGTPVCIFWLIFSSSIYAVSNYTLLALAFHRFLQLVRPFNSNEKITRKRIFIIAVAWLFPLVKNAISLIVYYFKGQVYLPNCMIFYDQIEYLIETIVVAFMPTTMTVLFNVFNIFLIYLKSRRIRPSAASSSAKSMKTIKSVNTLNDSASMDSTSNSCNNKNKSPSPQKQMKRINKDKKAVLCTSSLILNNLLTEYFFLIALCYVMICFCNFHLLNYASYIMLFFPLANPILLFIFHDAFRNHFLDNFNIRNLIKRIKV